jgi:hypothetical protein
MDETKIREIVISAVNDALKGASIIDGPTHIAHHQAIDEMLHARRFAYKTGIAVIISGIFSLIAIGIREWIK